jgi:hypothetical protein
MFLDPNDTDQVCRILQTYVEEWGKRNVVVTVPSDWQNYWTGNLGGVRLEFRRVNYVSIEIKAGPRYVAWLAQTIYNDTSEPKERRTPE